MKTQPAVNKTINKKLGTKKLRKLILETEQTLVQLKTELDRREQAAQANELENLAQHIESAELSLDSIKSFLKVVAEDLKK